jgi:tetratricopeptide (TPR) repeat protein
MKEKFKITDRNSQKPLSQMNFSILLKRVLFLLFVWGITTPLQADSNESLIEVGNAHYAKGEYKEAIAIYEQIAGTGSESATLWFNLGNACYKTGQIPRAILNYERARLLDPNDEDIAFNLEMSYTHTVDKIDQLPEFFLRKWVRLFTESFSTNQWAIISMIAFTLMLAALLIFFFSRFAMLKRLAFYFALLALLVSLISWYGSAVQFNKISSNHSAIVFSPSVTIKGSPDPTGTDLFILHEGTKVMLRDSVGDWMSIRLSDGNEGWIEKKHLEII